MPQSNARTSVERNMTLRGLLLIYDELDDVERRVADEYIRKHPSDRQLIEDGRQLRALLRDLAPHDVSENVLATVVSISASRGEIRSRSLRELVGRVQESIRNDPELARRYEEMQARMAAIDAALPPPREHFGALMDGTEIRPDRPRRGRLDRGAVRPHLQSARWAVALSVALVVVGVGLTAVTSYLTYPDHQRLAALHELPETFQAPTFRGSEAAVPAPARSYAAALETIHGGRSSVLGLFPRYEAETLEQASTLLREVIRTEPPGSVLSLEAHHALARVLLHQGDRDRAREHLNLVVARQGPSAPEAGELLHRLGE